MEYSQVSDDGRRSSARVPISTSSCLWLDFLRWFGLWGGSWLSSWLSIVVYPFADVLALSGGNSLCLSQLLEGTTVFRERDILRRRSESQRPVR